MAASDQGVAGRSHCGNIAAREAQALQLAAVRCVRRYPERLIATLL